MNKENYQNIPSELEILLKLLKPHASNSNSEEVSDILLLIQNSCMRFREQIDKSTIHTQN